MFINNAVLTRIDSGHNDFTRLSDLVLSDDEGWGQTQDVVMGGLAQQTTVPQSHCHFPRIHI